MQWYHYVQAALLGLGAYLYLKNRDTLSDEEREEFEAAMAQHEHLEEAGPFNEDDDNEIEEDTQQARDPAAALAQRQAENEQRPVAAWKNRVVGAKKAKSLARKEQRRMYFEYLANQAQDRRQQEEIENEMFGDLIAEEKAQRELRSEKAAQKLAEQQRLKREQQEKDQKALTERRQEIKSKLAHDGFVKVKSSDDPEFMAHQGTLVQNNSFLVGGDKVMADMIRSMGKGEASWDQLISL